MSHYPVNTDPSVLFPVRPPNLKVRGVVLVTRHGSRTPIGFLPGQSREHFQALWGMCPTPDHELVPCGRGQLTQLGEFQLQSAGWQLRQRYVHADKLLPRDFDPSLIHIRCTDLARTKLSVTRMMQGLYPGLRPSEVASMMEVRDQKDETIYPNHYVCPRLKELYIESCHETRQHDPSSPASIYKSIADSPEALALRKKIAKALHHPPEELGTWVVIGDELKCRQSQGIPFVQGIDARTADAANDLAEKTFWHIMRGGAPPDHSLLKAACSFSAEVVYREKDPVEKEVTRLGMGRLMGEIFDYFDQMKGASEKNASSTSTSSSAASQSSTSISSPSSSPSSSSVVPRAVIFSGHDTTLAPLLSAFHATHALLDPARFGYESGRYEELASARQVPGWPTLGSNMVLELLEVDERWKGVEEEKEMELRRTYKAKAVRTQKEAERSLEKSLTPLPPPATSDDDHRLPTQQEVTSEAPPPLQLSLAHNVRAPIPATPRPPIPTPPGSKWFIRLLVEHREVSLLPWEDYEVLRKTYAISDKETWLRECKQKGEGELPSHHW